jgi:hypothetical protein
VFAGVTSVMAACGSSPEASCPPGSFFDPNMGQCTNQMGGGCPPGTMWNGAQCAPQGGMACPPGQSWNGAQCAPAPQCPPGTQWQNNTCAPMGGVGGVGGGMGGLGGSGCSPASPLDPMMAGAATQGLGLLAQQHAPGATPVGGTNLAGNFQPGQCLEVQVTLNPGKCYTAVGQGAGVSEVELQLAAPLPGPLAQPFAQDNTTGAMAVLGGAPNCFRAPGIFPIPAKFVLKAGAGQGAAAAQLYEK